MNDIRTTRVKSARSARPLDDGVFSKAPYRLVGTPYEINRWNLWGLVSILVILGMTTLPWSNFVGHAHWQKVRWIPFVEASLSTWFILDVFGNILLFLPFGICGAMCIQNLPEKRRLYRVGYCAAILSLSVELFQVYCHNRSPAMTDVCTNVAGALMGALFVLRPSRLRQRLLGTPVWRDLRYKR